MKNKRKISTEIMKFKHCASVSGCILLLIVNKRIVQYTILCSMTGSRKNRTKLYQINHYGKAFLITSCQQKREMFPFEL